MPELPEVETICRILRQGTEYLPSILGMQVVKSAVFWTRSLAMPGVDEFNQRLLDQSIEEIERRGKFLIFDLTHDRMLVHLRMSGDLWVEQANIPIEPHHRIVIDFIEGWRLAFNDPRKFGRVWLVEDSELITQKLGPEPLDPDFRHEIFWERLHKRRRQLKPLLMDQCFLAGLGNIYTDEALHLAHLHPLRIAAELTDIESNRLLDAIRIVLEEGIRRNGSSIDWVYRGGEFQNYFRVYGRLEKTCPDCGTPIRRMVVGQRSTYYCPFCQAI